MLKKLKEIAKFLPAFDKNFYRNLLKDDNKIANETIKYGVYSLLVFCILFLFWATFVPISSAVIADGRVVLDLNHKVVQHLEGGIINEIKVKEGDFVKKGQVLFSLSDIKSKSDRKTVLTKLWSMKLQKERLLAEKNDYEKIDIEDFLSKIEQVDEIYDEELQEVINTQNQLFSYREEKSKGEIEVLQSRLIESQNRFESLNKQKEFLQSKSDLIEEELAMIEPLVKSNNISLTQKIDLDKQYSDIKIRGFELLAEIDKAREDIAQNKLQIANFKNDDFSKILDEIKQTEIEIIALENELEKAQDIFSRSLIVAPVSGGVMDVKYHTIGAVIQPAAPILTIVPQNDELIVEARIRPQDIDSVYKGLKARISLTAFKDRKVPKLNGEVSSVYGDIVSDERSGESYYIARIKIDGEEVKKLKSEIKINPGMPAQVFVITGSRTLLEYLFSPIWDAAYKAFREE